MRADLQALYDEALNYLLWTDPDLQGYVGEWIAHEMFLKELEAIQRYYENSEESLAYGAFRRAIRANGVSKIEKLMGPSWRIGLQDYIKIVNTRYYVSREDEQRCKEDKIIYETRNNEWRILMLFLHGLYHEYFSICTQLFAIKVQGGRTIFLAVDNCYTHLCTQTIITIEMLKKFAKEDFFWEHDIVYALKRVINYFKTAYTDRTWYQVGTGMLSFIDMLERVTRSAERKYNLLRALEAIEAIREPVIIEFPRSEYERIQKDASFWRTYGFELMRSTMYKLSKTKSVVYIQSASAKRGERRAHECTRSHS